MGYQKDRWKFIETMKEEGMSEAAALLILRNAQTMQRMAEAACNGDWPCDNGERTVKACSRCEGLVAPSTLKAGGLCDDCRAQARIEKSMPAGFAADFQGDPRGSVVKIKVPSGKYDDWGRTGICVPTRT